ncbi:MAG: pyridoxal 5'-phosphate synthase glutaminase subunit PdxT [Acidimicrobiales bacterium]
MAAGSPTPPVAVGVLALQGDVREHRAALESVGARVVEVRRPVDLTGLDGIVLPGGESTTLSMLLESSELFDPLAAALRAGLPAFGTCAGMILLAGRVEDGRPDQRSFGVLDCTVRRNGYGRQRYSFERRLDAQGLAAALEGTSPPEAAATPDAGTALPAVFIRAPVVVSTGPDVEVLASLPGEGATGEGATGEGATGDEARGGPVVVRQGAVLATTFHPELTADRRLHRLFVAMTGSRSTGAR